MKQVKTSNALLAVTMLSCFLKSSPVLCLFIFLIKINQYTCLNEVLSLVHDLKRLLVGHGKRFEVGAGGGALPLKFMQPFKYFNYRPC